MHEKHSEIIIGADKLATLALLKNKDGLSRQNFVEFCTAIRHDVSLMTRKSFEQDTTKVHFISYGRILRRRADGEIEVLLYKRPDQNNGESRLAGLWSCGIGGHIELADIVYNEKSVINLHESFMLGAQRELEEEVKFSLNGETIAPSTHPHLFTQEDVGFLIEWTNVGLTHLGVITDTYVLDENIKPVSGEDQLENVSFVPRVIAASGMYNYEGWSEILIKDLSDMV